MFSGLSDIIAAVVEDEKKNHGKRFSTHQEANACIKECFDDVMETAAEHARHMDYLWYALRHEGLDEDYIRCQDEMRGQIISMVTSLLMEYARLEKYFAGVVHEPKTEEAANTNE